MIALAQQEIIKIQYATPERVRLISEDNSKKYDKYLKSNIIKNKDVKETTYRTYANAFRLFLIFLAENYDNVDLYSDEFVENAVDIMEAYIIFCQDTLQNKKKIINTKLSAVSSFYIWSVKRGYVKYHPFDGKLDRMKKASEEHILNSYFLTDEQIEEMRQAITENMELQDLILFEVSLFSGNRLGALSHLTLSTLDMDDMLFENIREKEGYMVEVSFDEKAKVLIQKWLDMRKEEFDNLNVDNIFIHNYENKWQPWSRDMIYNRFVKFGKLIGINDFRTHCMRKTCIDQIYRTTNDLNLASEWANHKGTDVTKASYIKPESKSELREKLKKIRKKNMDNESK